MPLLACSFELINRTGMRDLITQPGTLSFVFLFVFEVKSGLKNAEHSQSCLLLGAGLGVKNIKIHF